MATVNIREFNWEAYRLNQMDDIETVKYLVIHHSDSVDVPIEEIDQWHRSRGYIGVGYHYLIRVNGDVEKGRPDNKAGAHAEGYNRKSLGICLTGNFTTDKPTARQLASLVELLINLLAKYPEASVVRHRDLNATSCPGDAFPWSELLQRLEEGGNQTMAEQWKLDIVENAKKAGLITSDHQPDDPAPKWFVLAVALNLLKAVVGKK